MQRELKDKILNEIAAGATPQQCADKYNIPSGTIRSWVSRSKGVTKKSATQRKSVATKTATQRAKECNATQGNDVAPPKHERPRKEVNSIGPVNRITEYKEKLTEKERLFCFYYVNVHRFNATQSYRQAYECAYSTARVEGSKLLTKPDIRAEINRLKEIKSQTIMLGVEDIVEKHMRIAFSNIADFVEFGQVEVPVMGPFGPLTIKQKVINAVTGKEEERTFPVTKIVNDVRFKESFEVDSDLIQEVKVGRNGASIKLYDAQESMDWLERFFEWNPMNKHKKQFDREKLKLERERLELERAKINKGDDPNEEKEDDGLISALTAKAGEVWADENSDA